MEQSYDRIRQNSYEHSLELEALGPCIPPPRHVRIRIRISDTDRH